MPSEEVQVKITSQLISDNGTRTFAISVEDEDGYSGTLINTKLLQEDLHQAIGTFPDATPEVVARLSEELNQDLLNTVEGVSTWGQGRVGQEDGYRSIPLRQHAELKETSYD